MRMRKYVLIVFLMFLWAVPAQAIEELQYDDNGNLITPIEVDVELVRYYPRLLNFREQLVSRFDIYWCASNTRGTTVSTIQGRLHLLDNEHQERMLLPWRYDENIPGYSKVCGVKTISYMLNSPPHDWLVTVAGGPVIVDFQPLDVAYLSQVDFLPFNKIGATRKEVVNRVGFPILEDTVDNDEYGKMKRLMYLDENIYGFPCVLQYMFYKKRLVAQVTVLTGHRTDTLLRLSDYEALTKHVESEYKSPAYSYVGWLNEWFEDDEFYLPLALISGIHERLTIWLEPEWFSVVRTDYTHGDNIYVIFVTADREMFFQEPEEPPTEVKDPKDKTKKNKKKNKTKKKKSGMNTGMNTGMSSLFNFVERLVQ